MHGSRYIFLVSKHCYSRLPEFLRVPENSSYVIAKEYLCMRVWEILFEQLVTVIVTSHANGSSQRYFLKIIRFSSGYKQYMKVWFLLFFFAKVPRNIEQVKCWKDIFCFGQMEGLKRVFKIMNTDGFAIIPHIKKKTAILCFCMASSC